MKITLNKYDLLTAVEKTSRVIRKADIESLEQITICAENNQIIFSANNGKSQVEVPCYGRIEQPGTLQIHKNEFDIVKKLSGDVTIEETNKGIYSLICGKRRITGVCSNDFKYESPALSDAKELFKLNSVEFIKGINKVKYAASEDGIRPVLQSVCIRNNYLTALDEFRLAKYNLPIPTQERDIIIPLDSVNEVEKLIGKNNMDISFSVDNDYKNLLIKTKDFTYKTNLCDGTYINIEGIIPENFITTAEINTDEFMESLGMIKALGKGMKKVYVEMNIEEYGLNIKFKGKKNNYEEKINTKTSGNNFKIGINNDYLIDVFKKIEWKNAVMQFNGPVNPMIIQNEDGSELHLILPVRLVS